MDIIRLPIYKAKDHNIVGKFSAVVVPKDETIVLQLNSPLEVLADYVVDIVYYTDADFSLSLYIGGEKVELISEYTTEKRISANFTAQTAATTASIVLEYSKAGAISAYISSMIIRKVEQDGDGIRYIAEKWDFHDAFMGERYVSLTASSAHPIDWEINDYLVYRGQFYYLNYIPTSIQSAKSGDSGDAFVYEQIKFEDEQGKLYNCEILDITPTTGDYIASRGTNYTGSSVFSIYCAETTVQMQDGEGEWHDVILSPVAYVGGIIQANLNRLYPTEGWRVDVNPNLPHLDDKVVSFNQWYVPQALAEIHNLWEVDYICIGRTIKIGYTLNNVTGNDNESFMFGYGEGYAMRGDDGKSLFRIKRTANSSQKIITRLRAMGSTRNMPYRYYNSKYNLPQTMFVQNLQLPDTFEIPSVKTSHNALRDEQYGTGADGYPNLRHVLGDTNDAYIDKHDDAASCREGIREGSAFWDGSNSDLDEIYPTIKEGTYRDLRAADIPDMDGRVPSQVGAQNAYPHYDDDERIDEVLGVDERTNIGDGIMTETDAKNQFQIVRTVRVATKSLSWPGTYGSGSFDQSGLDAVANDSSKDVLYTIPGVSKGKYQTEPVTQNVKLFAKYQASNGGSANVYFLFRIYAVTVNSRNLIAEYKSQPKSLVSSGSYISYDMPSIPNYGSDATEGDSTLVVSESCEIRTEFYICISEARNVNAGVITYYIDSDENDVIPEYVWEPQDVADTFLNTPFSIYIKDIGIDLSKINTTGEDATIHFNTGACGGMDFKWNPNTVEPITVGNKKGWKLNITERFQDNNIHAYYPNANSPIEAGNQYVLLNIEFPDVYIKLAEIRLLVAATDYLAENSQTKFIYEPEISDIYLQRNIDMMAAVGTPQKSVYWNLYAGYKFSMRGIPDTESESAPLPIIDNVTIQSVTIKEGYQDIPSAEIVLNDDVQQSTIQKLTTTVDRLYGSVFGSGGSGGGVSYSTLISLIGSEGRKLFLSKKNKDTAAGLITFLRGIALGDGYGITEEGIATLQSVISDNFTPDLLLGSGWGAWLDENGISTFEVDNLNVRMKAIFNELEIRKVSSSGGNLLFTSAGSKIQKVVPVDANGNETTIANAVAFRCDLFSDDGTTATMNDWMVGDQARCQQFNIKEGKYQNVSNRSYWRKVIATEERYDEEGKLINSVILAKNSSGTYKGSSFTKGTSTILSDYPQDNDTIVQLGNQTNASRQNAIELVANGENAPALLKYHGINDYTLDGKLIQGEYYNPVNHTFYSETYGNWYVGAREGDTDGGYAKYDEETRTFSVKGKLEVGSTLDDGRDVNALGTSRGNLLKNTGFTGDYESVDEEDGELAIDESTPIYSDPLKYWDATNVEVLADTDSASGYSAKLGVLSQTVEGGWKEGEWYMLSLRAAQGTLNIEAGGEAKAATLTDWERIDFPFQASNNDGLVRLSGTAKVCEIMLTAGNLPTEWHKASTDNDKSMAEFFSLDYLRKAITDATTNIIGGLVMTQILKVGNYRNGEMSEETGGMSGAYNDDKSPFLWGGGTMEDAIYTIMKYAKNPAYQPTEEEVGRMAKFVVTHGGRAILNDIVLRGYIYALGGVFNGTIHAKAGEFEGEENLYKISLDAASRLLAISGPSAVEEDGQPISGATQVGYMTIGGWLRRLNIGGSGYLITPVIASRAINKNGETTLQMNISSVNGLHFRAGNGSDLAIYSPNEAVLPSVVTMANLPTSDAGLSTGQIWNDNGTLKIKS